jgi:prophage DNA circulation protein
MSGFISLVAGLSGGSWLDYLQPASWRGVGFVVLQSEVVRGRRTALHEYPYGDTVWVEDLGRGTRSYNFRGFLVGDDCYIQEQTMLAAVEVAGPGTLVHPSLGFISANLMSFTSRQDFQRGRMVELEFSFIEGQQAALFPSFITSTIDAVEGAASSALSSIGIDFQSDIASPLHSLAATIQTGVTIASGAITAVQGVAATANRLVGDAGLITGAAKGLVGNYGRYASGNLISGASPTTTISSALGTLTTARTAVQDAGTEATNLAGLL